MKRLAIFVLSAILLIPSAAMAAKPAATPAPEINYSGEYLAFDQIAEYISEFYIDEYDKEFIKEQGLSKLLEGNNPLLVALLKSTLESMDDYSEFYTESEYKEFQNQINRTFYGIGITMRQAEGDYVEVTGFAEGNDNAQKAGLKIGDKIVKVNGSDVTGQSLSRVRDQVIGEEGTTVNITVLRDGKEIDITATRVAVNSSTVASGIFEGNIGYIQITTFGTDTADEFAHALAYMRENDVKRIILDLRDNGGGIVPSAVAIAQSIVPRGKIIDVKYRDSKYNMTYNSTLAKQEFDFEVLVNEYTASASEILASAIQDSKAGELIGTTTFGKAVIQNTFPLENGSVFKLTVGQYITRNGREINHIGLTPDIYVENVIEKLDTSEFAQFDFKEKTALGQKSNNARAAKERLRILGFFGGEVDDVYDMELREAVRTFQQTNGIFSYGVLDIPTQTMLEEKVTELDVAEDVQLKTAYERLGGDAKNLFH